MQEHATTALQAVSTGKPQLTEKEAATLLRDLVGPIEPGPMPRTVAYVHPAGFLLPERSNQRAAAVSVLESFCAFVTHPDFHAEITLRFGQPPPGRFDARSVHLENALGHTTHSFVAHHLGVETRQWLWAAGRRILRDPSDLEEALWSFLGQRLGKVCARWDRQRPFAAFVVKAFEYHCRDHRRLGRRGHEEFPESASPASPVDLDQPLAPLRAAITGCLERRPPRQRSILECVHRDGHDYPAVARAWYPGDNLDDPATLAARCNSLYQLHFRAKEGLLDCLDGQYGCGEELGDQHTFDALMEWYYAPTDAGGDA